VRFGVRIPTSTYNIDNITFTILETQILNPGYSSLRGLKMGEIKGK